MIVQAGLCQTWSETTLLVFPRDGSNTFSVVHDGIVHARADESEGCNFMPLNPAKNNDVADVYQRHVTSVSFNVFHSNNCYRSRKTFKLQKENTNTMGMQDIADVICCRTCAELKIDEQVCYI